MKNKKKPTSRRKFIKLLALGSTSLGLTSCSEIPEKKEVVTNSLATPIAKTPLPEKKPTVDSTSPVNFVNSENVTFYQKGQTEYERLRQGHNKRINKFPRVIALCQNEKGVQEALTFAAAANLAVAIKSSGHSLEGLSCNDDGMVINLSKLNSIEWLENSEVKLGPACNLSQLYAELLPKGRLLPGGSCGGVAVGGLTLGGGYGMFSRKYGLTCDSLTEVTMVDGTGKIINSKDDPELLWACKGGGAGNFGVITQMKFKTHLSPAMLTSHRFRKFNTDAQTAADILEKWFLLTTNLPESCFSVFILNRKTVFILLTNFAQETEQVKSLINELSALTEKTSLGKPQKLDSAVKTFYGIQEPIFSKNSSVGLYKSFADIKNFIVPTLEKISATPGMLISIGTLGGQIDNAEFAKNSAFAHRSLYYLSELQTYYSDLKQQEKLLKSYNEIRDIFQNNGINTQYINYPDLGFKDWEKAYYGDNYKRLQEVKRRYDPTNLIRHEQSVRIS
ncbi:MAG: FAD-binding oxidoreductase [Acidobacteria bacterium]|nr:FAD-binding oxidoreductase [Acidobacteriota bacterium]